MHRYTHGSSTHFGMTGRPFALLTLDLAHQITLICESVINRPARARQRNLRQIDSSLFWVSRGVSDFLAAAVLGQEERAGQGPPTAARQRGLGAGGVRGRAGARRRWARSPVAWSAWSWRGAWPLTGRAAVVGWGQVREWPGRRAGLRGASRPRWRQSRSPGALPGP